MEDRGKSAGKSSSRRLHGRNRAEEEQGQKHNIGTRSIEEQSVSTDLSIDSEKKVVQHESESMSASRQRTRVLTAQVLSWETTVSKGTSEQ